MELVATRSVVEGEVKRALASQRGNKRNSVLLLRADAQWRDDAEFAVEVDGQPVTVTVAACPTVLSVLAAMSAERAAGQLLVVLTPVDEREVGDSVLARAIQPAIKPVNRWDLVQDAFGASRLDPALTRGANRWVAEALLDAQPAGGWRRLSGTVLTWATALNRLAATRLGIEDADDSPVDAAALLQWTTDAPAVASFLALRDAERDGLVAWLGETAGPVAEVVFGMAPGKVHEAVPFGLVVAVLYGPDEDSVAVMARIRAEERYLGGRAPAQAALRAFGEAAESLVTRWADNGHSFKALELCERAERIIGELGGDAEGTRSLAGRSRVLEAGLDAQFAVLAAELSRVLPHPARAALAPAEKALQRIQAHGRRRDRDAEIRAAEASVRLARWLAVPEEPLATLADGATRMLRSWGWADRALALLDRADTSRVPQLGDAYAALWAQVRKRRAALDDAFARKLAAWTEAGSETGLICVENLLERIARPVAGKRLPVIVVLDGMSAAVACELAEEITARGTWQEAGRREDGREPALATAPSVTRLSRASLLTGKLCSGGQDQERAGFAAFWGRTNALVFHKADLAHGPGRSIADEVRDAILSQESAVAVVLNTIDDTLDKGKHGPAHWSVEMVDYLGAVLDEARRAGRPVILTADHGHVLEQGHATGGPHPASAAKSDSARYRAGTPAAGEIVIRGPRVLGADGQPGGSVVAAVDEAIHYTPRKAGYHGGASLAEVVIPVITLLPSPSLLPDGWYEYSLLTHEPSWWNSGTARAPQPAVPGPEPAKPKQSSARAKRSVAAPDDSSALFAAADVDPARPAATSLGAQAVVSSRMATQRPTVRRAPGDDSIAALIDALVSAGGRLTIPEAATAVGEPVHRMPGYLALVTRLLNVDGYGVLQLKDGGKAVELNEHLLRQQFQL